MVNENPFAEKMEWRLCNVTCYSLKCNTFLESVAISLPILAKNIAFILCKNNEMHLKIPIYL